MDAEYFAGLGWLFKLWADALVSLIISTEPLFMSLTNTGKYFLPSASVAWLMLLIMRVPDVGFVRGVAGGALILLVVLIAARPSTFTHPDRAPVQLNQMQHVALNLVLNVQLVVSRSIERNFAANSIQGTIQAAEAATHDAVERSASAYNGSDLARLIRDYNAQCSPDTASLASPEHAVTRDKYYSIGLLGGGGLGIPEDRFSLLQRAQKMATAGVFAAAGPVFSMLGLSYVSDAADMSAIASRRSQGIAALEASGKGFAASGPYSLPTQSSWEGTYSGKKTATADYLMAGDAPGSLSSSLEENATAWRESEGKTAVIGLVPGNCVEAYKLAQWGAEQAFLALEETGKKPTGGQVSSAESGTIGAALAWQRAQQRSFNGGEVEGSVVTEVAAGALAGLQMAKNIWSWLDMQTLLPAYVGGMAVLTWLVLLAAPFALLMSVIRGHQVLLSWCSLMAFPLLCVLIAQVLSVGISFAHAGISSQQAAVAAGWMGGGADLDVLRGLLGMAAAVFLAATTWLASLWTGVSVSGLAGSAGGAVATMTMAANVATSMVGGIYKLSKMSGAAKSGGRSDRKTAAPAGGSDSRGTAGSIAKFDHGSGGGGGGGGAKKGRGNAFENYTAMQRRKSAYAEKGKKPGDVDLTPKGPE